MTEALTIKVLCDQCGHKIGEVTRDEDGHDHYRPIARGFSSNISSTLPSFWCLQHGWTNPSEITSEVALLADDTQQGQVKTLRARVSPTRG